MQFCPKCKTLMRHKAGKAICAKCGHSDAHAKIATSEKMGEKRPIAIVRDSDALVNKVKQECPKCHHEEAAFWTKQTRSSDEAETQFFKCLKCGHTWRKYR